MKLALIVVGVCVSLCLGCAPRSMNANDFTESDGCKALLRDLKIAVDSPLGEALLAERFSRGTSGDSIIETEEEQLLFNVKERRFRIVKGVDAKTGAPHRIRGVFFVSDTGELKARFQ
jgi:hypothetical protein